MHVMNRGWKMYPVGILFGYETPWSELPLKLIIHNKIGIWYCFGSRLDGSLCPLCTQWLPCCIGHIATSFVCCRHVFGNWNFSYWILSLNSRHSLTLSIRCSWWESIVGRYVIRTRDWTTTLSSLSLVWLFLSELGKALCKDNTNCHLIKSTT